jgi:hypothetical protein
VSGVSFPDIAVVIAVVFVLLLFLLLSVVIWSRCIWLYCVLCMRACMHVYCVRSECSSLSICVCRLCILYYWLRLLIW